MMVYLAIFAISSGEIGLEIRTTVEQIQNERNNKYQEKHVQSSSYRDAFLLDSKSNRHLFPFS